MLDVALLVAFLCLAWLVGLVLRVLVWVALFGFWLLVAAFRRGWDSGRIHRSPKP